MKVLLVHAYYRSGLINGALTSIIDAYYNLKSFGIDVELKIILNSDIGHAVMGIVNNFGIPEITKCFTSERKFEADVIICSPCLLYNAFDTNIDNVELIADKIIILDSLEIQLSKLKIETSIGVFPPLNEKVNYKNCILLCNPSGFDSCTFETHEYYHKFSKRRLHDFKHTNIIRKRFDASGIYNYNRRIRHEEFKQYYSAYNENIGKIIFETIYLDGIVNYSSEKFTEDGLGYYLKLFGIDPAKDHTPLRISKQDIIDKLFMYEDDLLLSLL